MSANDGCGMLAKSKREMNLSSRPRAPGAGGRSTSNARAQKAPSCEIMPACDLMTEPSIRSPTR
eukprot:10872713-Lingulodinium_polyedra.AAC.1